MISVADNARELVDVLGSNSPAADRIDALVQEIGAGIADGSPDDTRKAMALLASGAGSLPAETAGLAATIVGAFIEVGHDPAPARPALIAALQTTLPACATLANEAREEVGDPPDGLEEDAAAEWRYHAEAQALNEAAGRRPSAADAWQRLHGIWSGAIALLSVDPVARDEARELAPIAESIQDVHDAGPWLRQMLFVLNDEPYVAIEPATGLGITGRMSGISDNFQLNVLLMDAFPSEEELVSAAAVAVARGEGEQSADEHVTAWWNLYTFAALEPGGALPDPTDVATSETWIWNEGVPADIPVLDGHRVILLGDAPYERGWEAQRTFLRLTAELTAEPLGAEDVAGWLAKIETAAGRVRR